MAHQLFRAVNGSGLSMDDNEKWCDIPQWRDVTMNTANNPKVEISKPKYEEISISIYLHLYTCIFEPLDLFSEKSKWTGGQAIVNYSLPLGNFPSSDTYWSW